MRATVARGRLCWGARCVQRPKGECSPPLRGELPLDLGSRSQGRADSPVLGRQDALKNRISEHYNSISGKPLDVPDYCLSSTLVTMMLDGLVRKHRLNLRDKKPADKEQ